MMEEVEKGKEKEKRRRAAAAYTESALEKEHLVKQQPGESAETAQTAVEPAEGKKPHAEVETPVMVEAEKEALQMELEQAVQKASEYFDGWQHERADFANYRKRIEREQSQWMQSITGNVIKKYLAVLDDMERAIKARPPELQDSSWADGFDLILRKLQGILEVEGVHRIAAESAEFNPIYHEAISHEEIEDHESGHVIEIVQQGYMLGDRVLRPALVRVAR